MKNLNQINVVYRIEHDTNPDKPKYRPPFLDHFDRKKTEAINNAVNFNNLINEAEKLPRETIMPINHIQPAGVLSVAQNAAAAARSQSNLQLQLNQLSAANQLGMQQMYHVGVNAGVDNLVNKPNDNNGQKFMHRNFGDAEYEYVRCLYFINNCNILN